MSKNYVKSFSSSYLIIPFTAYFSVACSLRDRMLQVSNALLVLRSGLGLWPELTTASKCPICQCHTDNNTYLFILGSGEQLEVKRLKNERDRLSKLQAQNSCNTAITAAWHLSRKFTQNTWREDHKSLVSV